MQEKQANPGHERAIAGAAPDSVNGTLRVEPAANADMIEGYMDGYDLNAPEPSTNRSNSYRHGFAVARAEKLGGKLGTYQEISARADAAMAADAAV